MKKRLSSKRRIYLSTVFHNNMFWWPQSQVTIFDGKETEYLTKEDTNLKGILNDGGGEDVKDESDHEEATFKEKNNRWRK